MYGNMTKTEAIKLATINPAITLNIDQEVGSIKEVKLLILSSGMATLYLFTQKSNRPG